MGDAACCCICTCLVIIILPTTLISLSLKTHNPRISVADLYIPAISDTTAPSSNASARHLNTFVFVDLRLRNAMPLNGLRYEAVNLTLSYGGVAVAEGAVAGFYQGMMRTARKTAVLRTRGMPWEEAFDRVARGMTVDVAVEVAMTVKLRRCGVYMRRKRVVVEGVVSVDGSGEEVDEKVVRLK